MGILSFLGGERTDKTTGKSKTQQEQLLEGTQAEERAKLSKGVTSITGTTVEDVTKQQDTITEQAARTAGAKTAAGTQAGITSAFGEEALGTLESIFSQIGGKVTGGGADLAAQLLSTATDFDPNQFIANLVGSARSTIDRTLNPQLAQLASSVGGNANSAVQIIRNQAEADRAGTLAGVEADATAQANQLVTQNIQSALGIQGQDQQLLGLVGELLKGGRTTTTGEFTSEEAESGTQDSSGRTIGSEQTSSVGSQESTQVQELTELINSLIKTNQKQTGTSSSETEGTATTGASFAGFLDPLSRFAAAGK